MSSETVGLNLAELPDDVLVMILQFVHKDDLLLSCRLLFKRLGILALHREVWRHRTLVGWRYLIPSAVLGLAPCLKKAILDESALLSLATTKCAIEHLTLRVDKKRGFNAAELAVAVCRQEALGRLNHLALVLSPSSRVTGADVLMRTLAASSSLESLDIRGEWVPTTIHPVPHGPPVDSLRRFRCMLSEASESFVNAVLARHANTMEVFDVCGVYTGYVEGPLAFNSTSRQLASLPKLRKLTSRWLLGLEALVACHSLTELALHDSFEDPLAVEGAAEVLRRATQLRSVLVHLTDDVEFSDGQAFREVFVTLIGALAVPGRSLEELTVIGRSWALVPPLCRALPALHQLSVLRLPDEDGILDRVFDELLQAISESTPALQLLEVRAHWEWVGDDCAHSWINWHRKRLMTTLKANSLLHLVRYMTEDDDCEVNLGILEACARRCPQEVAGTNSIGLFSHGMDKCPAPEHHTLSTSRNPVAWLQMQ